MIMTKQFVLSVLITVLNRAPITEAEQYVLNQVLQYLSDILDEEEEDAPTG